MGEKYRIVKVDWMYPYRVQFRRPLLASFGIPLWEFVEPYRWHKTIEQAQADMEHRQRGLSYTVVELLK